MSFVTCSNCCSLPFKFVTSRVLVRNGFPLGGFSAVTPRRGGPPAVGTERMGKPRLNVDGFLLGGSSAVIPRGGGPPAVETERTGNLRTKCGNYLSTTVTSPETRGNYLCLIRDNSQPL